jgi:phosphonate degradation associated HDIG domain protein
MAASFLLIYFAARHFMSRASNKTGIVQKGYRLTTTSAGKKWRSNHRFPSQWYLTGRDRVMNTAIIDEIFAIFRAFGSLRYGEDVTQLEHILQSAHVARLDGAPDSLIAAALLHDIGQFLDDAGNAAEQKGIDARHEISGAAYLAPYFPPSVTDPVRLHVEAKRYLCSAEPGYREGLSRASELSLTLQGGPQNPKEMEAFLATPGAKDALRLRRYDDLGKRRNWQVPGLESYRPMLESVLLR